MEEEDRSGKSRTKEELGAALMAVEETIIRNITKVPPRLGVMLPTIRDAIIELLFCRAEAEKDG